MLARKNARNLVVVAGPVVFKIPRDGKLRRILKEFALTWKAFLRGLAPPVILIGPVLLRAKVLLLKEIPRPDIDAIERAIMQLSLAGVEHRELRHPERHVGMWKGRWVFIDFDHGRLSQRSKDLNKFRAWAKNYKIEEREYRCGDRKKKTCEARK